MLRLRLIGVVLRARSMCGLVLLVRFLLRLRHRIIVGRLHVVVSSSL